MAGLDDIREKAEEVIGQVKPFVEGAKDAGEQFAEKADAWARSEHPGADAAFDAVSNAASGAVGAVANGANAAYEFIKDRAEEASGKDIDGDGQIGRFRAEDVAAAKELAEEAVAEKVDKVATEVANMTPGDVAAGAELAAEAVADKVDKVATEVANMTPGDVAAGAELAAEAVKKAVDGAAE